MEMDTQTDLPSTSSLPRWSQWLELGQAEFRSWELHLLGGKVDIC